MEGVASVFHAENAQQETIHAKDHSSPYEYCDLLLLGIYHTRHSKCESDGCKGKSCVWN